MIDPVSRQYRTCKIQSLFSYIVDMTKDTEGQKKDPPIKNTDESSLVDNSIEISNVYILRRDFISTINAIQLFSKNIF